MPGISFHSKLEPHFDFIMEMRRKHETWQAIVQALAAKGVITQKQLVYAFIKRRLKRRYPLGVVPAKVAPPAKSRPAHAEPPDGEAPELTADAPPQDEFASDPLTRPAQGKPKKYWGQL